MPKHKETITKRRRHTPHRKSSFKKMFNRTTTKIKSQSRKNKMVFASFIVLFAGVGGYFIINSFAATTPVAPTNANIWVSPTGSATVGGTNNCQPSSTPIAYDATRDCTWDAAYKAASSNYVVNVKSGSYNDVTMSNNRSSVTGVIFYAESGVVLRDYTAGVTQGPNWPCNNISGPSNITLNGPVKARNVQVDCTDNVTIDGWEVDCTGCTGGGEAQMFHADPVTNFTFRNGSIHDSTAVNPSGGMTYIGGFNLTFDNVDFYNAGAADSLVHSECMYVAGLEDRKDDQDIRLYALTIKNSTFYHCSYEDVFFGGSQYIVNLLFENNVVERDWNQYPTGSVRNIQPIKFRDSSSDGLTPDIGRVTLRYNTFRGVVNFGTNTGTYANLYVGPLTAEGNIFLSDITNCFSSTTASWSYNAYVSKNCGGTGSFLNSNLMTTTNFVNVSNDPGDWHLKQTATSLINKGNPSSYPPQDHDGNLRSGIPDIGAYEYGSSPGGGGTCTSTKTADINCDNIVSITDLSLLLYNYSKTTSQLSNPRADIVTTGTSAGKVDITDLSALLSQYGT